MIVIDSRELAELGTRLRAVSAAIEKDFHKGLSGAGEIVATEARRRANAFPRKHGNSYRLAPSIKVKRRLTSVKVVAGGVDAPEAAPLEHGGLGGTFRHPFFGNMDVWYPQEAHPFLTPAAEATLEPVFLAVAEEVDLALARL